MLLYFSGRISYQESVFSDRKSSGKYIISGALRGNPRSMKNGTSYRFLLDSLSISDSSSTLIISFKNYGNETYLYQSDPRLGEEKRKEIFNSFSIDFLESSSLEDHSLLRESFHIFIDKQGRILEFVFSEKLRKAIRSSLKNLACAPIVEEIFSHSERLPPLFSSAVEKEDVWTTEGRFLIPVSLKHSIKRKYGNMIDVFSESIPPSKEDRESPFGLSSWLTQYNADDLSHNWRLQWTYDESSQSISFISCSLQTLFSSRFLGIESLFSYSLNLSFQVFFEESDFSLSNF